MYNFEEFKAFRDGFLGAMEDDFHALIYDDGIHDIEFIPPNLDITLYELYQKSLDLIDDLHASEGYIRTQDYANLGHELYVALRYDASYTEYENHNIPDNYIFDISFDRVYGTDHDVVFREVLL